ncbi:sensor histidine kinase [Pedobacter africanus]|uniref:histidine kinase n=1 Tax=Pedobacter africanus TaxID=151894 RepID=A0A1W2DTJ2_9SPHI|nr:HAMP domain-containing sensor histidine kinase [Pedobacter africanus]SMD00753.1 PAS domain S-box-containing protein [Pedobacter africanus]
MDTLKSDFYQLIKTNGPALDFILESSSMGLWYCHMEDHREMWTNSLFRQTLGYGANAVLDDPHVFLFKEDIKDVAAQLRSRPESRLFIKYRHQNGTVMPAGNTGLLLNDTAGNPAYLLVAVQQIDLPVNGLHGENGVVSKSHQLLNDKLKLSEERFTRAFEHAAIGMAIVSLSGKWLRVNNSLLQMLGYTSAELMKLTFQDITFPDDLNKDLELLTSLVGGEIEHYQMEKRYFHKMGHIVTVILAVSLVKNSKGKPLHFISQITDISKMKAAETEIKSVLDVTSDQNRRLLNFAHIVSHNLRSHSGNLSMLLNFIETDTDENSRQELFRMFRDAASNLQVTIGHLNEVVAVTTTLHQHLICVNLSDAINGAIGNVEALLKAEGVHCINEVRPDVVISAVPAYLDSILLNFLTNAIKYHSKERPPLINLSSATADNLVELSIKDNGLGIDLKLNRDKIFGMYKTFHDNKDARGIGLFITKNQIEAMGGKVTVESEVGKGTIFKIYFKPASGTN